MKVQIGEKMRATVTLEQIAKDHEHDRDEYQIISRSSISKADFYRPEPDFYHSDLINF